MMEHVFEKGHRILCNTTLVGLTSEIIKRLENIKQSVGQFSVSTIQSFIQDIIDEKRAVKKNKAFHENLIAELKVKLKDAEDKLLRSLAENDNLRKRHDKEIEDNSKYAIKNFSYSLLNITIWSAASLLTYFPTYRTFFSRCFCG